MKEKINELIKDSIEKFNVYVDDAFVDTEENKKRLNFCNYYKKQKETSKVIALSQLYVIIQTERSGKDKTHSYYIIKEVPDEGKSK